MKRTAAVCPGYVFNMYTMQACRNNLYYSNISHYTYSIFLPLLISCLSLISYNCISLLTLTLSCLTYSSLSFLCLSLLTPICLCVCLSLLFVYLISLQSLVCACVYAWLLLFHVRCLCLKCDLLVCTHIKPPFFSCLLQLIGPDLLVPEHLDQPSKSSELK